MRQRRDKGMVRRICAALLWIAAAQLPVEALAKVPVDMREPDPAVWLRQIYDLYQRAETVTALANQATYRIITRRASKSLAGLFRKNDACEKKSHGICAIDWDFVIDGQDYHLSNVSVGPADIAGDTAKVTVSFRNFDSDCVNVYTFVREDGQWKVDDVLTKSGKDAPVSVAKLLRDFKP